jgi:hypothetical protein
MTALRWCDVGSQSWLPKGRQLLGASAARHVPLSDEISRHRPKTADSHSIANKHGGAQAERHEAPDDLGDGVARGWTQGEGRATA